MDAWKHVKVLRDGVDVNVKILDNFATHVAPALGGSRTTKDQSSAIHRLILAGRRTFA